MRRSFQMLAIASLVAIMGIAAPGQVLAGKPAWAGAGKGNPHNAGGQVTAPALRGNEGNQGHFFQARHRKAVQDYFASQYRKGHCPPGLAKKANGCMPPGQAKKWTIGRPLPQDVVVYDLPPAIVADLGSPPPGDRFVRVAQDILLVATGTNMVVDAIQDLNWQFNR